MEGIYFFEKNKIDIDQTGVSITVTDATATDNGQDYVDYMRNRSNSSGWATTGSNDAANTELLVVFTATSIDRIILANHNLKAYTIQYWDGASYQDFSTPISETTNTLDTTIYEFDSVQTGQIKIIITGTITTNDDKSVSQLILTKSIGQFATLWTIKKPQISKTRKQQKAISGKIRVIRNSGAFSCTLKQENAHNDNDLDIVETLYETNSFLVWLCGGDATQFRTERMGFRLKDFYLMTCANEYEPEWSGGQYNQGNDIEIELVETL